MSKFAQFTQINIACVFIFAASTARAQSEPLIARVEMQLAIGDKIVDTIRKGDMVNVLSEREDAYIIATMTGVRGAVDKVNMLKLAEAAELYTELIQAEPKAGQLYTLRASAWWARGDTKKALKDYDQAIRLGYTVPHAFSSRGLFHSAMGNHSQAIADYTTAIKKGKDAGKPDQTPFLNRAAVYVTQKQFDNAIADYTAAIQLDPKSTSLYQQRAIAYKLKGDLNKAIEDFSRAIQMDPKSIAALMGRGFLWYQLKKHQQAVNDFAAVIALDPSASAAYNNRGYNYMQLGQYERAYADYEKAIGLAPNYALAHQNRGWLLATVKDRKFRNGKLAVQSALKACELNNYSQLSDLMTLAAALAEDGNFKEAIGWQEKVIEMAQGEQKEFARKVYAGYKEEKAFVVINQEIQSASKS